MTSRRLCVLFLGICCLLGLASASDPGSDLPSVAELEKLNFTPIQGTAIGSPPYAEVSDARRFFVAYGVESKALKQFREPILTRGVKGESVFKNVSPAVVAVVVGSLDKDSNFNPDGLGTGAIVDSHGYVLTNWHVINGYRGALIFLKPSGDPGLANAQAFGARVVYEDSTVDLALLRMIDPPSGLHALSFGDISQVQIAEDIHIIGHPHGNFWSYSTGVVSQIRDSYTWSYSDGSNHAAKVLQLQTAINPGNSGGPVVDDYGQILGLVAMSEEGQNLDYAIAADVIKSFLSTGMQMNSRGVEASSTSSAPQNLFSGKLSNNAAVYKAVYSDAILYEIESRDGSGVGVVAKFSDGTIVNAWRPDLYGNFSSWAADFTDGRHFVAAAAHGLLAGISQMQTALPWGQTGWEGGPHSQTTSAVP